MLGAVTNSLVNGKLSPIQVGVTDIEKCFDKLWLQATINSLYDAGVTQIAQIAIKINNKLTKRIPVKDVIMQGSVWGSIKCTTMMDRLNKAMMKEDTLKYYYKNDKNIPIGVLGMVDDTITISECGAQSVSKNAVLNSFIENQRLTLSDEKSCVIHIGNPRYCVEKCPSLRVHDKKMKVASSARYLGDIITSKGGSQDTITKRRNEGWGRVSEIMGLISEIPSGCLRIQIGLKMRETKLCNGLIFNGEAWSSISDKDIERLEQVDLSLIRSLTGAHSETVKEFLYLELKILKP